jgi:hypothetical protein
MAGVLLIGTKDILPKRNDQVSFCGGASRSSYVIYMYTLFVPVHIL